MNQDAPHISVESLLAESAWVRSLARSLIFDQSQVDDVVQQTWVVALQRAPRRTSEPRAWLGGIVRNVVHRQVRNRQRRRHHETLHHELGEQGAGDRAQESAADLVGQAELFRQVVEAVLALDEPFRSVVILRYFKGLAPREIALQLDVPSVTVRTRLHRALERLRRRLDAGSGGDRRSWSLALIPLIVRWDGGAVAALASATGAGSAKTSLGVLSMTMKMKVALTTAVLALGGMGGWLLGDLASPGETSRPAVVDAPEGAELSSGQQASPESGSEASHEGDESAALGAGERSALTATAAPAPLADPLGVVLFGAVLDELGQPVSDELVRAQVRLQGPGGSVRSCQVTDATFSFAGLRAGPWSLNLDMEGFLPLAMELDLQPGEPRRQDLLLSRAVVLPVRIRTPSGESTQELLDKAAGSSWDALRLTVVATAEPLTHDLPPISHRRYDRHELGSYAANEQAPWLPPSDMPADCDGLLELTAPLPVWVSLLARHVVLATQQVPLGATEIVFVMPVAAAQGVLGEVRLTVVDAESGEPLLNARVDLSDSQSSGGGSPVDGMGSVHFVEQLPGLLELTINAPGHESLRRAVTVASGTPTDLGEVPLDVATALGGRVVDTLGAPVALRLHAVPVDRFDRDADLCRRQSWQSGSDGRFTFPLQGRERYVLETSDRDWVVRPQVLDARQGDLTDIELVVDKPVPVTLHASWAADQTRALRIYTETGAPVRSYQRWVGGSQRILPLSPGRYEYVVGARGAGHEFVVGASAATVSLRP